MEQPQDDWLGAGAGARSAEEEAALVELEREQLERVRETDERIAELELSLATLGTAH